MTEIDFGIIIFVVSFCFFMNEFKEAILKEGIYSDDWSEF